MPKSRVMTLRIDPELLAAVKERAKRLGRSASAEVVFLLERNVKTKLAPARPVMGMFSSFEEMDAQAFRRERRRVSGKLLESARKTASK